MKRLILILALVLFPVLGRASITYVQSANGYTANSGTTTVSITPTSTGHALILSVGMTSTNFFWNILRQQTLTGFNFVADNQNAWIFVGISPVQNAGSCSPCSAVAVFAATNVAAIATTITVQTVAQYVPVTVDEYSGVASIRAVDGINFNSTAYGSGLSSIASGTITITGTETVYSVGFADTAGETLTASAGFTQRQSVTNTGVTITTFDKSVTGGTSSNTISANSTPGSLHVVVLALSPTSVSSIVLQNAWMVNGGTVTTSANATFPYSNGSGNLLILRAYLYERGTAAINDTQLNNWVVPITPPGTSTNLVMAYVLSSHAGANSVTLNTNSGGNNAILSMVITEYNIQNATFSSSSVGNSLPGGTVNTGNVTVPAGGLLVSMGASDSGSGSFTALAKMGSSPNTWRLQPSDGFGAMNAEADQIVVGAGAYSNTFTASSSGNDLYSGILGFSVPAPGAGSRLRGYVIHSK
jgi:hypothetical protein